MRFRVIMIGLLAGMLVWSVNIHRQADKLLNEAKELAQHQEQTIAEQQRIIDKINEDRVKLKNENKELLARLINAEAGAEWCDPEMQRLVGVVALNRTKHEGFPDTLEGVIYDEGQYACVVDGNINKMPTERCYEVANDLIENGYSEPTDIIYQAEFPQGNITYKKVQNMYFCG